MKLDVARPRWRTVLWLSTIVTFSALVASIWSIRVPFYQQPDELAHVDYVFALFDAGQWFRANVRHPADEVTPQTRFLELGVAYRSMRYNPYARAPAGYGTATFFRRLDAGAPGPAGRKPGLGAAIPYLMYCYPPAYYFVEAAVLGVTYNFSRSLSDGFFAMRASNVLLLTGTLLLSFFAFRAYGIGERTSLLAVLAIGVFPLTSSISSYVQPDNATTFLVALIVCAVARGRRDSSCRSDILALGGLSSLFLVKPHYAFAAWLVTVPLLTYKSNGRPLHPALRLAAALVPLIIFAVSNRYLNPVSGLESPLGWIERTRVQPQIAFSIVRLIGDAIGECFGGSVFNGFWLDFGFRGGRIFSQEALTPILQALTIFGVAGFLVIERILVKRIFNIAKTLHRRSARRLVLSDHPANLFIATSATLVAAHVLSDGALELEGRYWCALLLPLALITLRTLPATLAPGRRRLVARTVALIMATYSLFSSAVAVRAMNDDFYGRRLPHREAVADLIALQAGDDVSRDAHRLDLRYSRPVRVTGYAIDMLTGLPAREIFVEVDHRTRIRVTSLALPYRDIADSFNDDRVAATRFQVDIPASSLPNGRHRLRFFVGRVPAPDAIPFMTDAWVVVSGDLHHRRPRALPVSYIL